MRRYAALLLLPLALVGCGQNYDEPAKDEVRLDWMYEATSRGDYPLTQPVIVGCGYFRLVGQKERHNLAELEQFNAQPGSQEWLTGSAEWSERMCAY